MNLLKRIFGVQTTSTANQSEPISNDSPLAEELLKRIEIPNTPFTIIETLDKTRFVTLGSYRLTEPTKKTIQEIKAEWSTPNWDRVIQITSLITELTIKQISKK